MRLLPDADRRGVDIDDCDVTDPDAVRTLFGEGTPSVVYNTAAYNAVDGAETDYEAALALNGVAPGRLAAAARKVGATFVTYSTDYVFGDGHANPIDESQDPAPLSRYGRSKVVGERSALQNNPRTIVVRTTGLYSAVGKNFVKTMVNLGRAGKRLTVVSDQYVSPTWVDPLARASVDLVEHDVAGVYHFTAEGACSWHELAGRIFEILDIPADLHPTTADEWGAAARRPAFSALDSSLVRALGIVPQRWDDMLETFLERHRESL